MAVNRDFKVVAKTYEEEEAYDYVNHRVGVKKTGLLGSVAHMVKGALGGGILGGHVAYMKAGVLVAFPINIIFGVYMTYCLYLLVSSAQTLYKRTKVPSMSYPDVGEAAMMCFPNPKVAKFSKLFRYTIDGIICLDLFGSCACYQLIIAKSIKQLVENNHSTSLHGINGLPDLRVYMAAMIIPMVLICLITHLKWLAPFSIAANLIILFCIFLTIHYAFDMNPNFENIVYSTGPYHYCEFIGMIVFSMSCAGVVIPIENNMRNPNKFPLALVMGMSCIICCTVCVSFFGYVAFLETCDSPITVNFPMETLPKILKGFIAFMIYITHAVNFWAPFNLVFYYLKQLHPPEKHVKWELIYRSIIVIIIGIVAIIFPNINALMGFLGSFCLSFMAFIWPNMINILVVWERPGLGKYNWRLWRSLLMIAVGFFIFVCGSLVNAMELVSVFI